MKLIYMTAGLTLLAGCASLDPTDLGQKAIEYNQALEHSVNVGVLSNVVRASERIPLIYSRMGSSTYTGSAVLNPQLDVGFASLGDDDGLLELNATLTDSGNTVFNALLGENFYNDILTSITPETISFYRDQGWPDEILFTLFIERVEFGAELSHEVLGERCDELLPFSKSPVNPLCLETEYEALREYADILITEEDKKKLEDEAAKELTDEAKVVTDELKRERFLDKTTESLKLETSKKLSKDEKVLNSEEKGILVKKKIARQIKSKLVQTDSTILENVKNEDHYKNSIFKVENDIIVDNDPNIPKQFSTFMYVANHISDKYWIDFSRELKDEYPAEFCDGKTAKSKDDLPKDSIVLSDAACGRLKGYKTAFILSEIRNFDLNTIRQNYRIEHGVAFERLERDQKITFIDKSNKTDEDLKGCIAEEDDSKKRPDLSAEGVTCNLRIVLRSPNSMLYYLGELYRAQREFTADLSKTNDSDIMNERSYISICGQSGVTGRFVFPNRDDMPLSFCETKNDKRNRIFWIDKATDVPLTEEGFTFGQLFAFDLNGKRYAISKDPKRRGRTMQFVALVNEIFAQNQSASEAPTVSIIQTSGG